MLQNNVFWYVWGFTDTLNQVLGDFRYSES